MKNLMSWGNIGFQVVLESNDRFVEYLELWCSFFHEVGFQRPSKF